jgi:hypothetical protein
VDNYEDKCDPFIMKSLRFALTLLQEVIDDGNCCGEYLSAEWELNARMLLSQFGDLGG